MNENVIFLGQFSTQYKKSGKINLTLESKKPSHATVPLRDKGKLTGKKPKRIDMK
jgi:hypothetical protein